MKEIVKPFADVLLTYQGTSCRVELWGHPEQALVIATEIPENTGKSITSVVTELASEVVRAFRLVRVDLDIPLSHPFCGASRNLLPRRDEMDGQWFQRAFSP